MSRLDKLTPAQRAIVTDLHTSLCVTSGAGCGKTRVLVERYIQFLENDLKLGLERLAAITFTEMAAAEMRDRIRQACRRKIDEVRGDAVALEVWLGRYWGVDTAAIDTIHGFSAALLRRYPIEAGVDPGFAMLDEGESALLLEDTVRRTMESLLEADNADLLKVLEHFDLVAAREILGEIVQEKREVLDRVAAPAFAHSDDEILRDLKNAAGECTVRLIRQAVDAPEFREAVRTLEGNSGRPTDRREQTRATALEQVARLAAPRTPDLAVAAAQALADAINLRGGSAKAWPSAEAFDAAKQALTFLRESMREALDQAPQFVEAVEREHLALARALFRTARAAIDAYEAAKARESALDFEDLQIRARNLLKNEPRVLADCRARYRAILVDELQDTNLLQLEIVDLLAASPPVRGKPGPLRPGALFGVGDPKQSIYRFRGAEFEVFQAALARVGPAGQKALSESFRLNPGTAALVNHLFAPLMGDLYEPVEGKHEQRNDLAAELCVVEKPEGVRGVTEDGIIEEARGLAARIEELIEGHKLSVWDEPARAWRPAGYGDVAILFRRMSNLHLYEEALERQGIPYYVVAGQGFYKQQEVLDVISVLCVLDDPSDELHLAGILRSPFFAVSDEGLYHLRRLGPSMFDALAHAAEAAHVNPEDRRAFGRAARLLPAWAATKDRLGLASLVEHVVFDSGYAASAVGRFGGARAYANLRQMADLARRFEQKGLFGLGDFINYVTDFMRSEMRAEQAPIEAPGGQTVRLMTIHKAKGLEFPIVVVPDVSYASQNRTPAYFTEPTAGLAVRMRDEEGESQTSAAMMLAKSAAAEAERQESRRLLYVALTRAKDYLILSSHLGYNLPHGESWLDLLLQGFRAEAEPGEHVLSVDSVPMMLMRVSAPLRESVNRTRRRAGPKGILVGGRVDWQRLHERSTGTAARRAAKAVAQVAPPARPAKPPTYVTATALNTYQDCGARFHWEQVLGLQSPEASEHIARRELSPVERGTLFHRAMELAESPDRNVVAGAADAAVREAALPPGADAKGLAAGVAEEVERFWRTDLGRRLAKAPPDGIHREMPLVLKVADTQVGGKIDLLFQGADGAWELVDYKSSRPAEEDAPEAAAAYRLQLGLYALAAGRWLGRPIARGSVYFAGSGVTVTHEVAAEDLGRAESDARKALEGIAAGRFNPPADRKDCGKCHFGRLCRP